MTRKRIAVVGGGISGLTAAYYLSQARKAGAAIEEYLFEASPRLGGVLRTEHVEGCLVEAGPDAFLTEKREALELCQCLGLEAQLIGSQDQERRTLILHKGRLVPLPEGFEFMVPTRPLSVVRTPLLSLTDKLALVSEVFLRPHNLPKEESVASFVRRHFGRSLLENVVDPLLAAVYGSDADRLSAQAVLPRLVEIERKWGSLILGLRRAAPGWKRKDSKKKGERIAKAPLFTTLRNGLETLVAALRMNLDEQRVFCQRGVIAVSREPTGGSASGYRIHLQEDGEFKADAVIVALPARAAARTLGVLDRDLTRSLLDIHYSSSVIVALGYERAKVQTLPRGFGFLVPRKEGGRIRACSFVSQKFLHRVPANRVLLRCFLGGTHDEAVMDLSDAEATAAVCRELAGILGISAAPLFTRIYRWPKAMAQYTVGHQRRLEDIHACLRHHSGLFLCGNAYEGIGIPDCIRSGKRAARDCCRQIQET